MVCSRVTCRLLWVKCTIMLRKRLPRRAPRLSRLFRASAIAVSKSSTYSLTLVVSLPHSSPLICASGGLVPTVYITMLSCQLFATSSWMEPRQWLLLLLATSTLLYSKWVVLFLPTWALSAPSTLMYSILVFTIHSSLRWLLCSSHCLSSLLTKRYSQPQQRKMHKLLLTTPLKSARLWPMKLSSACMPCLQCLVLLCSSGSRSTRTVSHFRYLPVTMWRPMLLLLRFGKLSIHSLWLFLHQSLCSSLAIWARKVKRFLPHARLPMVCLLHLLLTSS